MSSRLQTAYNRLKGGSNLSIDPNTGNTILNFERIEYQNYVQKVFINKLDDYMLTHNHITLSIVDITGLQTPVRLGEAPVDPSLEGAVGQFNAEQLLAAPAIPFAYSGAISENDLRPDTILHIQDFNFKSIRCPSNIDPYRIGFQSGNMVINESYGFTFDDLITEVAVKAGYVTWESESHPSGVTATRFIYRIDIHFSGWREDGVFEDKIEIPYPFVPGSQIKRNTFTLFAHVPKTEVDISATGSSTVLNLVPYSEISSYPENALFPEMGSLATYWKEALSIEQPSTEGDAANKPSIKKTDTALPETRSRFPEFRMSHGPVPFIKIGKNDEIRENAVSRNDEKDITLAQWIEVFKQFLNENTPGATIEDEGNPDSAQFVPRNIYGVFVPEELLSEIVIKGTHPLEYIDSIPIDRSAPPQEIISQAVFHCPIVREGLQSYPRILYIVRTQIDYSQATYYKEINDWLNIRVNFYVDQFEDYRYIPDNQQDTLSNALQRMLALISTKSIKRVYHDDHFGVNTEIISYNTKLNYFYYKNLKVDTSDTQLESIFNELRRKDFVVFDKDKDIPKRESAIGLSEEESQKIMKMMFEGFQGYDNTPFIRSSSSLAKINTDNVDPVVVTPHLQELLRRRNSPIEGADQASINADRSLASFVQKSNPVDVEVMLRRAEQANFQQEYNNMMEFDLMTLEGFEVRGDPQWLFGLIPASLYPDYDQQCLDHTRYTADVIMIKSVVPEPSQYMATQNRHEKVKQQYNVSGLYQIYEIEHKFQGGNYTQTMNGVRLIGLDTKADTPDSTNE